MLIDTHCHLPHKKYEKSVETIIKDAYNEGVTKLITIGTDLKNNEKVIETAENFENVFCAIGIYPNEDVETPTETLIEKLNEQIDSSSKVVGIGECGYDITEWEHQRPLNKQRELFERQIELAIEKNLPLVLHNRNGDQHVLESLKKFSNQGLTGVAHCFTQDWEFAKKLLDLDFYISFSGILTYKSGSVIYETAKKTPLDRVLVETDAPYLSPQDVRNQINEPKYVKMTAKTLA